MRYALSENEILLEVKDEAKNKVHRMCKTLFKPIVSKDSSVQLLVDYIIFKLKKDGSANPADAKTTWDQVGYDIKNFNIPDNRGYMRSNFLKQKSAEVGELENKENQSTLANGGKSEQTEEKNLDTETEKDYHKEGWVDPSTEKPKEMTPEEKEAHDKKVEEEQIQKIVERARTNKQMCFLNLQSDVFKIY